MYVCMYVCMCVCSLGADHSTSEGRGEGGIR